MLQVSRPDQPNVRQIPFSRVRGPPHLRRFNVYFSVRVYLGIHTSATGCRVWLAYQSFVSQSLLYCVEGLLMYRGTSSSSLSPACAA